MITFNHVSKTYLGREILKDVTFTIEEGEFIFLVGSSGSGKTTIIKLLIKDETPTEGEIIFDGTNLIDFTGSNVTTLRRQISVIFQDFKLLPHKNVFENIAFVMEVAGKSHNEIKDTVDYSLELVNLQDKAHSFPEQLSGGEKQKIAIARGLAGNPKVLIADEPTGNLDEDASNEIVNILDRINKAGTTVVMATHSKEIVKKLNKRVFQLKEGVLSEVTSDNVDSTKHKEPKESSQPPPTVKKEEKEQQPNEEPQKLSETKDEEEPIDDFEESLLDELDEEAEETSKEAADEVQKLKKEKQSTNNQVPAKKRPLNISFTTKRKLPTISTKPSKPTNHDDDRIEVLKLPQKTEDVLKAHGVTTLQDLLSFSNEQLLQLKGVRKIDVREIKRGLKNLGK